MIVIPVRRETQRPSAPSCNVTATPPAHQDHITIITTPAVFAAMSEERNISAGHILTFSTRFGDIDIPLVLWGRVHIRLL